MTSPTPPDEGHRTDWDPDGDLTPAGAPRCTATAKGTGKRCAAPRMLGQNVCRTHGGGAPQSRKKAQERLAEAEASKAVERFALRRSVSPSEALLEELQWTAGNVEYFRQKVQELGEERLVSGVTKIVDDPRLGRRQTVESKPSVWYELWMREREHLVKVAAHAARAGVEQRRIELAEQTGLLVATVVRRILDALLGALLARGIDVREVWDDEVRTIVPREFRAIEAATIGAE